MAETTYAEAMHQRIIRTAIRLFSVKGYRNTSIDDIARELGVTKGAIYYHINSKADLLTNVYDTLLTELLDNAKAIRAQQSSPADQLHDLVSMHLRVALEATDLLIIFFNEERELPNSLRRKFRKRVRDYTLVWQEVLERGRRQGQFANDADPKMMAFTLIGTLNSVIQWYRPDGEYQHQQIVDLVWALLTRPLIVAGGCQEQGGDAR